MKPIITKDIFEIVTILITQKLEAGIIPWQQPWTGGSVPRNLITQRPYRGINYLLLNTLNYASKEFLTFKQIQDIGGRVKKGEKAHLVILWIWIEEEDTLLLQEVKPRKRPLLRYYFVFNASQCINLPERSSPIKVLDKEPLERCESIVKLMPSCPPIVHNDDGAYYNIDEDFINMPPRTFFKKPEQYFSTLFHEMVHSTGSSNRLNRKELVNQVRFGDMDYSIEELTAEIGACYLSSYAGIATNDFENSVAYIQGWLNSLKKDKKFIVYASAQAQKAVDFILNVKHEDNLFVDELYPGHEQNN